MARKLTPADAARLLALAAAYDKRTTSETDDIAWADALYDLDPEDCAEAIRLHYRETDAWLMPAHVRQRVAYIRNARADERHNLELRRQIEAGHDIDVARAKAAFEELVRPIMVAHDPHKRTAEQLAANKRALQVPCSWCKSAAGAPCTTVGRERGTPHPSRIDAASQFPVLEDA